MDAAAIRQCPSCGRPVGAEATACVHCGTALPPSPPTPEGVRAPAPGPVGPLPVPRRSFTVDFLWVAVLGWLAFGPGFSWLATRNSYETFGENLRTVGVWSGLMFGVSLGLALAWYLRPVSRAYPIDSPEGLRARLYQALTPTPGGRRVPYALRQDAGHEILLYSTSAKLGNRLQEETALIRISASRAEAIGTRAAHSWLRKRLVGSSAGR